MLATNQYPVFYANTQLSTVSIANTPKHTVLPSTLAIWPAPAPLQPYVPLVKTAQKNYH